MGFNRAWRLAVVLVAVSLVCGGCSHIPGLAKASPSPHTPAAAGPPAKSSGPLDAQVNPPVGFPADFPVYPKARLTAGASFRSPGQAAWGMEWETTDQPAEVDAFYVKKFESSDWKLTVTAQAPEAPDRYGGSIVRKSNPAESGTFMINADYGMVMINLALLVPT
jgi:hypothetical protein